MGPSVASYLPPRRTGDCSRDLAGLRTEAVRRCPGSRTARPPRRRRTAPRFRDHRRRDLTLRRRKARACPQPLQSWRPLDDAAPRVTRRYPSTSLHPACSTGPHWELRGDANPPGISRSSSNSVRVTNAPALITKELAETSVSDTHPGSARSGSILSAERFRTVTQKIGIRDHIAST